MGTAYYGTGQGLVVGRHFAVQGWGEFVDCL
jgi:hypothetical protein